MTGNTVCSLLPNEIGTTTDCADAAGNTRLHDAGSESQWIVGALVVGAPATAVLAGHADGDRSLTD